MRPIKKKMFCWPWPPLVIFGPLVFFKYFVYNKKLFWSNVFVWITGSIHVGPNSHPWRCKVSNIKLITSPSRSFVFHAKPDFGFVYNKNLFWSNVICMNHWLYTCRSKLSPLTDVRCPTSNSSHHLAEALCSMPNPDWPDTRWKGFPGMSSILHWMQRHQPCRYVLWYISIPWWIHVHM